MGVGKSDETVSVDEKGRILIPVEIRKAMGKKRFRVEMADRDTIILRSAQDRAELVKKIKSIKLRGDPGRASMDAATASDHYTMKDHMVDERNEDR